MKVTAIGVNAAFSTGEYEKVVAEQDAYDLLVEILNSSDSNITLKVKKGTQFIVQNAIQN